MLKEDIKVNVNNVTKIYRAPDGRQVEAVASADFVVNTGEFLVLLGPSGCGKSTILRIVAGLEKPTTGQVYVNALRVDEPGPDRGLVFQSYTSFPWLTVSENIAFGLRLRGVEDKARRRSVDRYLQATGLQDFCDRYPEELSGGMKQRVAIARTLANEPEVLLMDEPFGALDAETRWQMQELLLRVWRETGLTVLFVTHDIEEALFLADRIYVSTARPSSLRKELTLPFGRPRTPETKIQPEFGRLVLEIAALIRNTECEVGK
jgi:NitT/TauT family transport system ATP-binding protein/sulfonate transport system ATP-binding protein